MTLYSILKNPHLFIKFIKFYLLSMLYCIFSECYFFNRTALTYVCSFVIATPYTIQIYTRGIILQLIRYCSRISGLKV